MASFILRFLMTIVFISHFVTSSRLIEVRSMSKYKSMKHNKTRNEKKYLIVKGKADDYDQTKMPNQSSLPQRRQDLMSMPNIKKSKSGELLAGSTNLLSRSVQYSKCFDLSLPLLKL